MSVFVCDAANVLLYPGVYLKPLKLCESEGKLVSSVGEPLGTLICWLPLLEKHMSWLEAT